ELLGSLQILYEELKKKKEEFKEIIKAGRTHLQDAVPITLGQEFSSYAEQIKKGIERIKFNSSYLEELPLGGTAIGTGINTHPEFGKRVIDKISQRLGISFKEASNKFEGISAKDAVVHLMGSLNTLCVSLMKIANDLRILSSGPRTAIGEIILPAIQAGSSIMPGKVNPVIPEIMMQICAQVIGNALTVSIGGQNAPLELNVMMPIIAYNMIFSIEILKNGIKIFAEKCIRGIEADVKRCRELMEWSIGIITPLALKIGYDKAAEIAFKAYKENKKIKDVLVDEGILTSEEVEEILKPEKMLGF
ncbi:MAG: lyase family protein, partial [candidate division WOR-3 bacterium]